MKVTPSFEELKKFVDDYKVVPVSCELMADIHTPIEVLRILKNVSEHCYMLESAAENERWGRYTFLGFEPRLSITCTGGNITIGNREFFTKNPSAEIRKILAEYKSPRIDGLPTFTGGLVGYFAYDYICYSEPTLKNSVDDTENFKDVDLMLFDKVIAFDNFKQKIILIVNASTKNFEESYKIAVAELKKLRKLILHGEKKIEPHGKLIGEVTPLFDKETYCAMVERAKNHIYEGDHIQNFAHD